MIRTLRQTDIKACVDICEQTFKAEAYRYDVGKELDFSLQVDKCFAHEYFVFEEDGIIKGLAGLMNVGYDDGIWGICGCYVHQDHRDKKIGYRLTDHRIKRIKEELGGVAIFSTTKKTWHLERFGFIPVKTNYQSWVLMQLNL